MLNDARAWIEVNGILEIASNIDIATAIDGDPVTEGMNLSLSEYYGGTSLQPNSLSAGVFTTSASTDYPYMAVRYPAGGESVFRLIFFGSPFEYIENGNDPDNWVDDQVPTIGAI